VNDLSEDTEKWQINVSQVCVQFPRILEGDIHLPRLSVLFLNDASRVLPLVLAFLHEVCDRWTEIAHNCDFV